MVHSIFLIQHGSVGADMAKEKAELDEVVEIPFNVDLTKLESDKEKFDQRISSAILRIDDRLKSLKAIRSKPELCATLVTVRKGLLDAQKEVHEALQGLGKYATSDKKTVLACLDINRDCIGYPGNADDIQIYYAHIKEAIKTLNECGAFTMSSELVPMDGMALWSKMHQDKATQLAADLKMTTLEGSLGGSLFDQCLWGTKWQALQGDPLVAQWKDLSVIAANMAIKNKTAHVLLLEDAHPRSAFTTQELPHLVAHGITVDGSLLQEVQLHRYALTPDLRAREILIQTKLDTQNSAVKDQYIVVHGKQPGDIKIYFQAKDDSPKELTISTTPAAIKQLKKLNDLVQLQNTTGNKQSIRAIVHALISSNPDHQMTPELKKHIRHCVPHIIK
jgi:hypothetical protein